MTPLEIVLLCISILLIIFSYLTFRLGIKKGEKDFLEALFIAGLMGKVEAFSKYNTYSKPGGIVFVGDSITQDFNVYEYFPGKSVYNRGIGGDTSIGLLKRLKESVFDLKPAKVFLNIGTNDLELTNDSVEVIHSRIESVINQIKNFDNSIELYFISVYPVNPKVDPHTVGKRSIKNIKALNNLIKDNKEIVYINAFDNLLKDDVLNPEYTIEGLHMNQLGYEVIKNSISKFL